MAAPRLRDAALIDALQRRLDPADPVGLANLAWFAARRGDPALAQQVARRAAALPGAPPAAWRALERLAIGRTDGLVLAAGGLHHDTGTTRASPLAAAVAAHGQAAFAVAEACYQAATGDPALAAAAWHGLAVLHEQRGEREAALEAWRHALGTPTHRTIHDRAVALLRQGDLAAARAFLACHATHVDRDAPLLFLVGYAALLDQDAAMARLSLERALEIDADLARAQFTLGLVHQRLGQLGEAAAAIRRALLLSPWYLPQVWLLEPTPGGPPLELPAAGAAVPDIPDALMLALGRSLLAGSHLGEALAVFDQVLLRQPGHTGALFHRGVALAKLRRYGEALEDWEAVRARIPEGPLVEASRRHADSARRLAELFAGA